jgi:predicted acyltransferase
MSSRPAAPGAVASRSLALDVFRGGAVALMILVNNPGSWDHIYPPLAHAAWHGCTPTDLVFPFFIFAVGVSMAFAGSSTPPAAQPWGAFARKVATRAALIFAIGLFLHATPFVRWNEQGSLVLEGFERLRIMGVLQRIALAYLGAALLLRACGERVALPGAAVLLIGYWAACVAWGRGADPYSLEGFFGTAVDRALLGAAHLYQGEGVAFDPEGLVGTVPAIAQVLLGYRAGCWLARQPLNAALVVRLFVSASALLALAYAASLVMPVNKKLWTSSFVLLTSGLALMALALLVHTLDLQHQRGRWVQALLAFGRNALFVYALSQWLPRVLEVWRWRDATAGTWTTPLQWMWQHGFARWPGDPCAASLAFAVAVLAFFGAVVWLMERRGWRVRI